MTWSTNNDLTNPFSARSMTDRYLTDQALKNERSRLDKLTRNDPERSSGSSNGSNTSHSQNYINMKEKLFSNSSNSQKSFDPPTSSNDSGTSTFSGRIKNCSVL